MTYGWAILVIAVVLSALFALGVFNGNTISENTCIATPGFLCKTPIYSHSDANIIVTIGQSTGTSWTSANIVFVPQGTPNVNGVPSISFNSTPANTMLSVQGMPTGATETLYLPVNSITFPVSIGTVEVGTIWAEYYYQVTSQGIEQTYGPAYVQIASLNLKAS
ncbi:MAG: hypothetical protein KGI06_01995 [Candidatus Micrarchaeota archaeon]|nr:hypothetical protein [Candidatus Micrarchaeota archaeon]